MFLQHHVFNWIPYLTSGDNDIFRLDRVIHPDLDTGFDGWHVRNGILRAVRVKKDYLFIGVARMP